MTVQLESLTQPERMMLKMAWAATTRRPLHLIYGPQATMQNVAHEMINMGLLQRVPSQYFAVTLTPDGFALAMQLQRQGWPDTERAPE